MTPQSLARLEASFERLAPQIETMTRGFYDRLFSELPETRALFRVDMAVQRQHLGAALAVITRNLRMLDVVTEPLRQLGADHARVGVKPEHYVPVRDAMLFAIGAAMGDAWNVELKEDWRALLDLISEKMLEGASRAAMV